LTGFMLESIEMVRVRPIRGMKDLAPYLASGDFL
jgi:hypothetical protein